MNQDETGITKLGCVNHDCEQCKAQRTWQRLTDEEVDEMWERTGDTDSFANAIESKLKQKNGYAEEKNT